MASASCSRCSGGHLFLDLRRLSRRRAIEIVDVRPRVDRGCFAAEGWAKVHAPNQAVLRADRRSRRHQRDERDGLPRRQNHSPIVVLGGRAPAAALGGRGRCRRIDHIPFRAPRWPSSLRRRAATEEISPLNRPWRCSRRPVPHGGAAFVDFPRSTTCFTGGRPRQEAGARRRRAAVTRLRPPAIEARPASCCARGPRRPVIMAGHRSVLGVTASRRCLQLAEGRCGSRCSSTAWRAGCVPADHELFFSRGRGALAGLEGCRTFRRS